MFKHRATTAGAVLLIGLIAGQSAQADKFESFDSAESAAANGWSVTGSGGGGGTAGWAAPGEAQFDPSRGPFLSYQDTNLGTTINGNSPFKFQGTLKWIGNGDYADADTGTPPTIGFSDADGAFIGFILRADGNYPAWQARYSRAGTVVVSGTGNEPYLLPFGTATQFSMNYDPNEGEFGVFRVNFSLNYFGEVPPEVVWTLDAAQRESLNGAAFDRAGFFKLSNGIDNSGMELRFDDLTYTGGGGSSVDLPGDFNGDTVVDAADYTVWRDNLGASDESSLNGNGDGLGGVDELDYAVWKSNFGESGAGAFSGSAVPEPATWLLLVLAGAAVGVRRRSR